MFSEIASLRAALDGLAAGLTWHAKLEATIGVASE
jgi:hypothetical protein